MTRFCLTAMEILEQFSYTAPNAEIVNLCLRLTELEQTPLMSPALRLLNNISA